MGIMTKEKQITTADELENELSGYIGTELWYRTPYGFLYTDGVRALAEPIRRMVAYRHGRLLLSGNKQSGRAAVFLFNHPGRC